MRLVVALIVFLTVSHARAADPVFPSSVGKLKIQTVASGLVNPWSLAFLPDGRMLVTERPGRMRIVATDGRLSPPIGNVPKVYAVSQSRTDGRPPRSRFCAVAHDFCLLR